MKEAKKKKKILVIADSPLAPSGVGTQTKYMVDSMLRTGEYSFVCLAGALKHVDYKPIKVEPYGEDYTIYPVDGYGNPEIIRTFMFNHKPDVIWFMTDTRFWEWLWEMSPEIRPNIPMIYYHVWDNYPYPTFNTDYYKSNDIVCTISKVTDDIVRTLAPEVKIFHVPHTVDTKIFKKLDKSSYGTFEDLIPDREDKVVFFWNNRNARRKQSGSLIFWFKEFLDIVGHDRASLIMHTDPKDPHGQDLVRILEELSLDEGQVMLSTQKLSQTELAKIYNLADCTINISDAEGFGLSTLESLACSTPIIVNMTGGLQEQVTDGEKWFGIGIEPTSKAIIGSQDVPFIYEDRISKDDFIQSLLEIFNMHPTERQTLGEQGRNHVMKDYSLSSYSGNWYQVFKHATEECGSWETRKNYKSYSLEEM